MKDKQDDMLEEYDFTNGIRGKYAKAYHEGSNDCSLGKILSKLFPNEQSINDALRGLAKIIKNQHKKSA